MMDLFSSMTTIRFGIREVSAFVAHSFSDEDADLTRRLIDLLGKLGIVSETGQRPEPQSVSQKVRRRILDAELFVGLFTRRNSNSDGTFSTSPWLIEEKAAAIQAGKRLLLFVEDGVERSIGGLQGDFEYIPFEREKFSDALIRSIEYVFTVTKVPIECDVNPVSKHVSLKLGKLNQNSADAIGRLRRELEKAPESSRTVVALAKALANSGEIQAGIAELNAFTRRLPHIASPYHELGHFYQRTNDLENALISFQKALDRAPQTADNYLCNGKCLYERARSLADVPTRKATLEKARRLLDRSTALGGDQTLKGATPTIFLIDEALAELGVGQQSRETSPQVKQRKRPAKKTTPKRNPKR